MAPSVLNFFSRAHWGRDIALILILKVVLLFLIWVLFFRGEEVPVNAAQMARALHLESRVSPNSGGFHHDQ